MQQPTGDVPGKEQQGETESRRGRKGQHTAADNTDVRNRLNQSRAQMGFKTDIT